MKNEENKKSHDRSLRMPYNGVTVKDTLWGAFSVFKVLRLNTLISALRLVLFYVKHRSLDVERTKESPTRWEFSET